MQKERQTGISGDMDAGETIVQSRAVSQSSEDSGQSQATGPRYVELVRVSGRGQVERETPESQRRALDQLARRRPGRRVARIEALAVSAAIPLEQTAQGKELLALADHGFDELRLWDIDRGLGARADDPRDRLAIFGIAREADAVIVDCAGRVIDPSKELGELDYYLRTFFAAQERRKIAQRTQAGRKRIAADGGYAGAGFVPYGLDWDRDRREWSINDSRAAIVRDVYRRCLDGQAAGTIANELNARGVPTQQGKRWHQSTVVKMLRMPAYRGEHGQEGLTIALPAIIDESVWFQVQRVLDLRPRRRRARSTQSLCVGRVWCPCGQRAYVRLAKNREYIYCVTRHNRWRLIYGGKPCEYSVSHRADRIDPVIWDTVAEAITQPEILRAAMAGEDDSAVDAHRQELERCDELLQRLITSENEISRAFRRGNLSADVWNNQLKEIAVDRRVLERSRDAAREQLAMAESTDYSIDLVEAQLDELQDRVRAAAPEDRKAIIESVIPGEQPFGIVLWPDGKIDIRGAIPVPAESDVAKPSSLPGQERQTSVKRLAMHPATLIIVASLAFLLACQQAAPSKATHPTAPRVEYLTSEATRSMNLPFSDAVRVGSMLYLSGQIGIQPGTLKLVPGGIAAETRQALDGIKRVLEAHGSSLDRVVKVTVMMADIAEWPAMNQVYVTYFTKHKPARSAFAASGLALNARVEIEVIATVD